MKKRFAFNDEGQDLLWIEVDITTEQITDCGPFHAWLYVGYYVFLPKYIRVGELISFCDKPIIVMNQPLKTFKYEVVKIEEL